MAFTLIVASLAALSFGVSNFAGGRASRSALPIRVAATGHAIGLVVALVGALIWGAESFRQVDLLYGAGAGVVSAGGVLAMYIALRHGSMGVVMPIIAGIASAIPAIWGLATGTLSGAVTYAGLAAVFAAVMLVSIPGSHPDTRRTPPKALVTAALAGACFASSFFFLSNTDPGSGLWPTVTLRIASTLLLVVGALVTTRGILPPRAVAVDTATAGVMELVATFFVLFAVQSGPVAIAAVVIGLYPGVTAALARIFLHEKLAIHQVFGIFVALLGIALLSI